VRQPRPPAGIVWRACQANAQLSFEIQASKHAKQATSAYSRPDAAQFFADRERCGIDGMPGRL
jgi:hypothetical protein